MFRSIFVGVIATMIVCVGQSVSDGQGQTWRTSSGYYALEEELGKAIPNASGITVSQVEAPFSNGAYKPDPGNPAFTDPPKNFFDQSNLNDLVSGHANNVSEDFFSNTNSLASGITDIFQYEANDWINIATGFASSAEPMPHPYAVQNHSWIGNGAPNSVVLNIARRIDYMANANDMSVVAGVASNGNSLPQFIVQGYNLITVGLTSGFHVPGLTQLYGSGRVKPDIVTTAVSTSRATPRVSGVAAFLRDVGQGTAADNNVVIKALILAGATKVEFPDWEKTETVPLDTEFGTGELNVYNSYHVLQAGESDGQTSLPSSPTAGPMGWDSGVIQQGQTMNYLIELTEPADHLSILLTWNIDVFDANSGPNFTPNSSLSNLDLLFAGSGGAQFSTSTGHNIEHVYVRDLEPGLYTVAVLTDQTQEFALAWRAASKNEVTSTNVATIVGTNTGGNLADTFIDDGNAYEVQPQVLKDMNTYGASVEFETLSPVNMPNSIQFDLIANARTPNISQEIELFNFTEKIYESFDQSNASFDDSNFAAYVNGELYDFVDPKNGTIRARVTWQQVGPVLQTPWKIRINRAAFTVSQ